MYNKVNEFDKVAKMAAGVGNERSTNVQLLRQLLKQISGEDDNKLQNKIKNALNIAVLF